MSMINEIKKELKGISPWPWCDKFTNLDSRVLDATGQPICADSVKGSRGFSLDFNFIASSPERIAALVEYVKAAEEKLSWGHKELCVCVDCENFEAARRKLGLEG